MKDCIKLRFMLLWSQACPVNYHNKTELSHTAQHYLTHQDTTFIQKLLVLLWDENINSKYICFP